MQEPVFAKRRIRPKCQKLILHRKDCLGKSRSALHSSALDGYQDARERFIPYLLALVALTGCIAPKSFLEPKYRGVGYQDIKVPDHAIPVELVVTGETNGDVKDKASEYWRRQVIRVLTASRVFVFSEKAAGYGKLSVVIDNVADRGSAAGKGFMTGADVRGRRELLVTDGYTMTVEYSRPGKHTIKKAYQHAIYTTIGNASPPPGITPVSLSEAPSLVAEDMLLHFVKDLQDEGDQSF